MKRPMAGDDSFFGDDKKRSRSVSTRFTAPLAPVWLASTFYPNDLKDPWLSKEEK